MPLFFGSVRKMGCIGMSYHWGTPSHIAYLVVRLVIVRLYDYKSSRSTITNRAKKSVICIGA